MRLLRCQFESFESPPEHMKIQISSKLNNNVPNILRQAGYMRIFDRKAGKESFSRKLSTGHYPRFHLYIKENSDVVALDLHLDQTESRYEGQTAHNADYNSEEVKNELGRLHQIFQENLQTDKTASENPQNQKPAPKKSWIRRLLDI